MSVLRFALMQSRIFTITHVLHVTLTFADPIQHNTNSNFAHFCLKISRCANDYFRGLVKESIVFGKVTPAAQTDPQVVAPKPTLPINA